MTTVDEKLLKAVLSTVDSKLAVMVEFPAETFLERITEMRLRLSDAGFLFRYKMSTTSESPVQEAACWVERIGR